MKNKHRKGTLMKEKLGKQILAVLLTFTLCLTSVEWSGIAGMIHSVHAKQTINETSETKKIIEKTKMCIRDRLWSYLFWSTEKCWTSWSCSLYRT